MRDSLFHVERMEATTLQAQIREMLVTAMLAGQLPASSPIPSTRAMAKRLKVSRNTVMLAYQALAADGYLEARERSGFYVSAELQAGLAATNVSSFPKKVETINPVDWNKKLRLLPSEQSNIVKPPNWHDYPYPFIYGQSDPALFPITAWRDCTRQAMNRKWLDAWTDDRYSEDDPRLVEQIRQRILPRRGILAESDEILVTLGAQNALYLLANLLVKPHTAIAIEDPGYPDMRNTFTLMSDDVRPVAVDDEGIDVNGLTDSEIVFVTPSHQFPTNVTMSLPRRRALLEWADKNDGLIIEDDYEFETNYIGEPTPALKSLDGMGRVLYIGSLSKSIMPGLRMGYLVGPSDLIAEVRALRRLMLRHPPGNNQRIVALFLSLGRHDALIARLHRTYGERWKILGKALADHFPGWFQTPGFGGTSFWVRGPDGLDADELAVKALEEGVVIEPGHVHFASSDGPRNYFRLGFSSIADEQIEPGIIKLAAVAKQMM
ncbi:MAG: PLP-dependent aminotransferase family protein [Alphaproteobacteria bacterium]